MNEQELMMKKKIEKREKIDNIIAYILLLLLIICIAIVVYVKFFRKEQEKLDNEYMPNYITLADIASGLSSRFTTDNDMENPATVTSNIEANSLIVNYEQGDRNVSLNIPLNVNELEVTIDKENQDIIEKIYKEIAVIICEFYGNNSSSCYNTIDKVDINNPIDGIRFESIGDNTIVYLDINKKIAVIDTPIYNSMTIFELANTDYILNLNNITINNIAVNVTDTNISVMGDIENLNNESNSFQVVAKLYDTNNNVISESTYDFTEDNFANKTSHFTITFSANDVDIANVQKYSIDVNRQGE